MDRTGLSMSVELKHVHLNWGTTSTTGDRKRNELEAYIPIKIDDARRLNLKRGVSFYVKGQDFKLRASGTQSDGLGKNFQSEGNLKLLGWYLKEELGAKSEDIVEIYWESKTEVSITLI